MACLSVSQSVPETGAGFSISVVFPGTSVAQGCSEPGGLRQQLSKLPKEKLQLHIGVLSAS